MQPYGSTPYGAPSTPPPGQFYQPTYAPAVGTMLSGPKTNGLAVAALVMGCCCLLCGPLTGVLAVIFGFVARSQIRRSEGMQTGNGMAIAGIVIGLIFVALTILYIVLVVVIGITDNSNSS
ncbi:MAG TPA: DUF4190 domain-containing protein [Acidimicrobiales bacterium]|nr:DUF4190 domain-containing protein [Acidimicrobiales bacterium]